MRRRSRKLRDTLARSPGRLWCGIKKVRYVTIGETLAEGRRALGREFHAQARQNRWLTGPSRGGKTVGS
jgi:hypothetical protein